MLPLYGGWVPAGFPSPAEDYLENQLDLNEYLVRNKAATFLMWVEWRQYTGAGIFHGDLIVVDRAAEPVSSAAANDRDRWTDGTGTPWRLVHAAGACGAGAEWNRSHLKLRQSCGDLGADE